MSNAIQNFALSVLNKNPNLANSENGRAMVDLIKSGDDKRGEEVALNICKSFGVTPEDALLRAKQFFNIP